MGIYLPLVIPEKYQAHIMNMYHNSLLAMHQGPYKTFLTIRKEFPEHVTETAKVY